MAQTTWFAKLCCSTPVAAGGLEPRRVAKASLYVLYSATRAALLKPLNSERPPHLLVRVARQDGSEPGLHLTGHGDR